MQIFRLLTITALIVCIGILNVKSHCVVGNGVVVHLRGLLHELQTLREADIDYKGMAA
jgi:adenylosuccinate synthase